MRISRGQPNWQRKEGAAEERVDESVAGRWWIPGHEDLHAEGTANVYAKGLVWLDLDGDPWRDVAAERASTELRTVLGETLASTPMSLHAVRFFGGEEQPLIGRAHVRYIADELIFGAHAETDDDVLLSRISVSFRGLREWLTGWASGTSTPLTLVSPSPQPGKEEPARSPDAWRRSLSLEIDEVQLVATVDRRQALTSRFRTVYDTTAILRLESPEPKTLMDWRREWVDPLRNLVLFGTREQTVLLFLRGRADDEAHTEVRAYRAPEVMIGEPNHVEYYQRDLLPAGIWDGDGFSELIASWLNLHIELGPVGAALFEILNTAEMPPLTRLLRLTSCAEGYQRALHDEPPFSQEDHNAMVDAMIAGLPEVTETRRHYRDRLRYANSQSQRQRIKWLINRAAEVDDRLTGQASALTGRLVGWRNDQTHLDGEISTPPLDDLLLLNAILTYVLEANMLLDLGIGDNTRYCLGHGHVWDDPVPTWLESRSSDDPAP